jgi:hypothetical protein
VRSPRFAIPPRIGLRRARAASSDAGEERTSAPRSSSLGGRDRRDVIATHPSLPTSETRESLSFFFTRPLKKPRTECGCQPVLAVISLIVMPDGCRNIWITRSCLLCEVAARRLGWRAVPSRPCEPGLREPSCAGGRRLPWPEKAWAFPFRRCRGWRDP